MVQKAAFKNWHYTAYREGNFSEIPPHVLKLLQELFPQSQPAKVEEKPKFVKKVVETAEEK